MPDVLTLFKALSLSTASPPEGPPTKLPQLTSEYVSPPRNLCCTPRRLCNQHERELCASQARAFLSSPQTTSSYLHRSPLHLAVVSGDAFAVGFYLESPIDPNLPDDSGMTPLHSALCAGHNEILLILLKHPTLDIMRRLSPGSDGEPNDISPTTRWHSGCTQSPLHYALMNPNVSLDVIKVLVQRGADVNETYSCSGFSPLHYAVLRYENPGLVRLLLDLGCAVNKRAVCGGYTAMDLVVYLQTMQEAEPATARFFARPETGLGGLAAIDVMLQGAGGERRMYREWNQHTSNLAQVRKLMVGCTADVREGPDREGRCKRFKRWVVGTWGVVFSGKKTQMKADMGRAYAYPTS